MQIARVHPLLVVQGMVLLAFALVGCASEAPPSPAPSRTPGITLTPYLPAPPSGSPTETPSPVWSPTPPPTPTPTPYLYQIVASDTLLGIAFRFGVTLEELLAANPGIDPQFLTIGGSLVIPLADNPAAAAVLPTPVGEVLLAGTPACWPTADGGLWCFALFENRSAGAVESLAARLLVYGKNGEQLAERTAVAPVNLLPAGLALPVIAWFPGVGADYGQAGAVLQSALPIAPEDPRYVPIELVFNTLLQGGSATVSGTLAPVSAEAAFTAARLAVVAYDSAGRVVGVRAVELLPGSPLDEPVSYSVVVFSEGGEIAGVEVFAEAYP